MRYIIRLLQGECPHCGLKVRAAQVGVTSLGELALMWECRCVATAGNIIVVRFTLEDIIKMIPPPPEPEGFTEADIELLKGAHITVETKEETDLQTADVPQAAGSSAVDTGGVKDWPPGTDEQEEGGGLGGDHSAAD